MDPDDYAGEDGLLRFHMDCRSLAMCEDDAAIDLLANLMRKRANRTYEKHDVPRVVAAAIAYKQGGIDQLISLLPDAPGHIYPLSIVDTLWRIAQNLDVPNSILGIRYEPYDLDRRTRELAREKLGDLIVEAEYDRDTFEVIAAMLGTRDNSGLSGEPESGSFTRFFLESIRDSSIVLTSKSISEFEKILQEPSLERKYQEFLRRNPVFIDPLAAEVVNQAKLGTELETDFVVRRHDYRYVVVEIEKPKDKIFTQKNDFTAKFSHAVGQVLDFQGWIADNIAYAQKKLPLVENPDGLVVIGRRRDMSHEQEAKLRRWNTNSRNIEAITYDDVYQMASHFIAV